MMKWCMPLHVNLANTSRRSLIVSPTLTKKFQILIPLLENLCQFEETVVRDAAIQSIVEISEKITEEECISVIVPCILRLADGAWFTSKVSAIILMSSIYEKTGEYKTSLRK